MAFKNEISVHSFLLSKLRELEQSRDRNIEMKVDSGFKEEEIITFTGLHVIVT